MDLSQQRPTERFSALADCYQRFRPSYPDAAIDFIMERCALGPSSLLVDVGAGTGIASRLFAARGVPVLGVEPNAEMRRRAEAAASAPGQPVPRYCEGTGEATGLPDAVATAVLSAQAFHWCKPELALPEFVRILKPGGWAALMWYERDETDAFTAAYGDLLPRCRTPRPWKDRARRRGGVAVEPSLRRRGAPCLRRRTATGRGRTFGASVLGVVCSPRGPAGGAAEPGAACVVHEV